MLHLRQRSSYAHLPSFNRFELGILNPKEIALHSSCIVKSRSSGSLADPGSSTGADHPIPPDPQNACAGGAFEESDSSCGIEFSTGYHPEEDSDVSSPPLWKSSPLVKISPAAGDSPSHQLPHDSSQGDPTTNKKASDVVQFTHEITLKDMALVPVAAAAIKGSEEPVKGRGDRKGQRVRKVITRRRSEGRRAPSRSKSLDMSREFLLKIMFLPAALGDSRRRRKKKKKKKKKKKRSFENGGCVLGQSRKDGGDDDRTTATDQLEETKSRLILLEKSSDAIVTKSFSVDDSAAEQWWKKRLFSGSRGSVSTTRSSCSSSRSHDSGTRRYSTVGFFPSCWPFVHTKSKATGQAGCLI